jgi:hypothetical protein
MGYVALRWVVQEGSEEEMAQVTVCMRTGLIRIILRLVVVVSKNEIEDLGPVRTLRSLTKLSASHNGIIVIPDLSDLHDLGELRLNDNKILTIPDTIHLNFNLKILELGNNRIAKLRCDNRVHLVIVCFQYLCCCFRGLFHAQSRLMTIQLCHMCGPPCPFHCRIGASRV